MPLLSEDARIIDELRRVLGDGLIAVYRFGSSARGEAGADSACDLGRPSTTGQVGAAGYSARNAVTGSVRPARTAGAIAASRPAPMSTPAAAARLNGSAASTP